MTSPVLAYVDPSRLDTPDDIEDFHLVVYFTITVIVLGCVGCLYVFYRAYKQWILNKKRLTMIYKLPFYTACTDFLININFFINIIHTALYAKVWEEPACKIMSVLSWTFVTFNLFFYSVIAITTYLRICRELYFRYGKYDYKLWLSVIIINGTFQLINMKNHGARKYWCAGRNGQNHSAIILFSLITIVFVVILFCYINILSKIMRTKRCTSLAPSSDDNCNVESDVLKKRLEIEKRAAKKILSYILMFVIQWIPIQIALAGRFYMKDDAWLNVVQSFGRHMGGVGNAIQYIINEGWIPRETSEFDSPDIRSKVTNKDYDNHFINNNTSNNNYELNKVDSTSNNDNNDNDDDVDKSTKSTEHLESKIIINDNDNDNNHINLLNSDRDDNAMTRRHG